MNCATFTAVIAKYGMLRNIKEATNFFSNIMNKKLMMKQMSKRSLKVYHWQNVTDVWIIELFI